MIYPLELSYAELTTIWAMDGSAFSAGEYIWTTRKSVCQTVQNKLALEDA